MIVEIATMLRKKLDDIQNKIRFIFWITILETYISQFFNASREQWKSKSCITINFNTTLMTVLKE